MDLEQNSKHYELAIERIEGLRSLINRAFAVIGVMFALSVVGAWNMTVQVAMNTTAVNEIRQQDLPAKVADIRAGRVTLNDLGALSNTVNAKLDALTGAVYDLKVVLAKVQTDRADKTR